MWAWSRSVYGGMQPVRAVVPFAAVVLLPVTCLSYSIERPSDHIEKATAGPHRLKLRDRVDVTGPSGHPGATSIFMLRHRGQRNAVAVLLVGGQMALNPSGMGFDYGDVPELKYISMKLADQIWGPPKLGPQTTKECEHIYHLVCSNENGGVIPTRDFFLDVVFEKQVPRQFRIRSAGIDSSWWAVSGGRPQPDEQGLR